MAKNNESPETNPAPPLTLKRHNSSAGIKNSSILNFFAKAPAYGVPSPAATWTANGEPKGVNAIPKPNVAAKKPTFKRTAVNTMTPVASSDVAGPPSSQENENHGILNVVKENGLPSPTTPAKNLQVVNGFGLAFGSSPLRKVCRTYLSILTPNTQSDSPLSAGQETCQLCRIRR